MLVKRTKSARMRMPHALGVIAVCMSVAATAAHATDRTVVFEAQVDNVTGVLVGVVSPGDKIQGYYTFDDATGDSSADPGVGVYQHTSAPHGISMAVIDADTNMVIYTFETNQSTVAFTLQVVNNSFAGNDLFQATSLINKVSPISINAPQAVEFELVDPTQSVFTNDSLLATPPNLANFSPGLSTFEVFKAGAGAYMITGSFVSFGYNIAVDTDGFATAFNCEAPNAIAFPTITAAVDFVSSGTTIKVCPGTYIEDVAFPIGKDDLELVAIDPIVSNTVIEGVSKVPSASFPLAVPNIEILGNGIELHGFTVRGPAKSAGFYSSGMVIGGDNVHIHDNVFEVTNADSLDDISQAIQTYRDANNPTGGSIDGLNIHDNVFGPREAGTHGYEGIYVNHVLTDPTPSAPITIADNQFGGTCIRAITTERSSSVISGNSVETTLDPFDGSVGALQGILVRDYDGRDQQNVTVTQNTVRGTASGWLEGLRLGASSGQLVNNVTISENEFSDNDTGINLRGLSPGSNNIAIHNNIIADNTAFGLAALATADVSGVAVNENSITGNGLGVSNLGAGDLDASANWHGSNVAATVAASVSSGVDYTPWLDTGANGSTAPEFVGDLSTLYVDDDSPQTGVDGRIQEGIDRVTASTVIVLPGLYIESNISIDKSVHVMGDPGSPLVAGPDAGAAVVQSDGTVLADGFVIESGIDDVIIEGLFIRDYDNGGPGTGVGIRVVSEASADPSENITIRDNQFDNNIWAAVFVWNSGQNISNNIDVGYNVVNMGPWSSNTNVYGIELTNAMNSSAHHNTITGGFAGVLVRSDGQPSGNITVEENNMSGQAFLNVEIDTSMVNSGVPQSLIGVTVRNNIMSNSSMSIGTTLGSGLGVSDLTIEDNQITITNPTKLFGGTAFGLEGTSAVELANTAGTNSFSGNTLSVTGTLGGSLVSYDGVSVRGASTGDWTIASNMLSEAASNGAQNAGARVAADVANAVMIGDVNQITGWINGVAVHGPAIIFENQVSFGISSNAVGIRADGANARALIRSNNLSSNSQAGIYVINDAVVDAGDSTASNFTGLGSSDGCNFLAGYTGGSNYAINDQNEDDDGNIDVLADMNFWGVPALNIEDIVNDTNDNSDLTLVRFDDPKPVPQLVLTGPSPCSNAMSQVAVTLEMKNLPGEITGFTAFLEYDPGVLTFNGALSSYTFAPFPLHIIPITPQAMVGEINLDGSVTFMQPGTSMDSLLATLVFDVVGCGDTSVSFRPPPSMTIDSQVSSQGIALPTELIDADFIIDNGVAPMVSTSTAPSEDTGALCQATMTFSATVTDGCCLNEADVMGSVSGDANVSLGSPTFMTTQISPTEVEITGSVVATLLSPNCSGTVTWNVDAADCCGNAMATDSVMATIADNTAPTFVTTPPAMVTIECSDSLVPGILYGKTSPTSGFAVYFNDNGGGEDGVNNVAYYKLQHSLTNTNGAQFNFDNTPLTGNGFVNWQSLYGAVPLSQFGLDLSAINPDTFDGSVVPTPLIAMDKAMVGSTPAGAVTWAINDYKNGSPNGPANPATSVVNSLIRAASPPSIVDIEITQLELSGAGPIYTVDLAGKLQSDGLHHWFDPNTPDSPMSNFSLNGEFYFSGQLTYDSTLDSSTNLVDFYQGEITVVANSPNLALGFPTAIDNCTLFPTVSYNDDLSGLTGCNGTGTIIRTWTAADDCGNSDTFVQTITVVDTTAPTFVDCPGTPITVKADAGGCSAVVTFADPMAEDACDMAPMVACVPPSGSVFNTGMPTTVTCTASDACGNMSICEFDVVVQPVSELVATVALDNVFLPSGSPPVTVTRRILFRAHDGMDCSEDVCVEVEFTGNPGDPAVATVVFDVECGNWTEICAKDEQHTLWSTVPLTISGTQFETASVLTLLSGDTDNDSDVDINDVTFFLFKYGLAAVAQPTGMGVCGYNGMRDADFSLNGFVGTEDYSFLVANWQMQTFCDCTPPILLAGEQDELDLLADGLSSDADGAATDGEPIFSNGRKLGDRSLQMRLSTSELDPMVAALADLTRDGVVDWKDVQVFERRHGISGELSARMRAVTDDAAPVMKLNSDDVKRMNTGSNSGR